MSQHSFKSCHRLLNAATDGIPMKVGFEQVYSLLVWGWCTPYSVAIFHRRQCCQLDSTVRLKI